MRKIIVFMLVMGLSTAFAKGKKYPPAELNAAIEQVVYLTDLTPQITEELFKGIYPNVALKCEEGTELPLKFMGNFGFFSVKFSPDLTFKVEKTCYLRFIKKKTYLSYDLKNWEKPETFIGETSRTNAGISKDQSHVLIEMSSDLP